MPHILQNPTLKLHIDLPHEHYQLSRFDWTGKITDVFFKEKSVCTIEKPTRENEHLFGKGLYNEFGMDGALGFDEAEIGGWFHKIGVGLLKKDTDSYDFQKPYEIMAANFELVEGEGSLLIRCEGVLNQGYGYVLEKKIELTDSSFSIDYFLKNKGEHPIITQEYTHNFLCLDEMGMGKDYELTLPFALDEGLFEENINPGQTVDFKEKELGFHQDPKEVFFFSQLSGKKEVEATWSLKNHKRKIGISEKGDFPTSKVNLWGSSHVISPELFVDIHIEPEGSKRWSRTYEIFNWE